MRRLLMLCGQQYTAVASLLMNSHLQVPCGGLNVHRAMELDSVIVAGDFVFSGPIEVMVEAAVVSLVLELDWGVKGLAFNFQTLGGGAKGEGQGARSEATSG